MLRPRQPRGERVLPPAVQLRVVLPRAVLPQPVVVLQRRRVRSGLLQRRPRRSRRRAQMLPRARLNHRRARVRQEVRGRS